MYLILYVLDLHYKHLSKRRLILSVSENNSAVKSLFVNDLTLVLQQTRAVGAKQGWNVLICSRHSLVDSSTLLEIRTGALNSRDWKEIIARRLNGDQRPIFIVMLNKSARHASGRSSELASALQMSARRFTLKNKTSNIARLLQTFTLSRCYQIVLINSNNGTILFRYSYWK